MDIQEEDYVPRAPGHRYFSDAYVWPILALERVQRELAYFSREDGPFPKRHRDTFAQVVALLVPIRRELQQRPDEVTHERLAEERGSVTSVTSAPLPAPAVAPLLPASAGNETPPATRDVAPATRHAPLLASLYPQRQAHWLLVLAAQAHVPRRTIYSWWQEWAVAHHSRTRPKYATVEEQAVFVAWVRGQQVAGDGGPFGAR
jgi:hypothetical protein